MDYIELTSEKDFLDVEERAQHVYASGLHSYDTLTSTATFYVNGLTDTYEVQVRVTAMEGLTTTFFTRDELAEMVTTSDLEVSCSCPAFLYWGFQYVHAVQKSGIWIASIDPKRRNPNLIGGGCKHVHSVLEDWPRWAREIAAFYQTEETAITPVGGGVLFGGQKKKHTFATTSRAARLESLKRRLRRLGKDF